MFISCIAKSNVYFGFLISCFLNICFKLISCILACPRFTRCCILSIVALGLHAKSAILNAQSVGFLVFWELGLDLPP